MARCFGDGDPLYERYHDEEWGVPVRDERGLYERISLEAFQSGLSWITILRKRDSFRAAFAGFDPERVAGFGPDDVARLLVLLRTSTELRDVAWAEMTHANARDHVDLWRDVVRRAPAGLRADPAALLGFAAWLSGHGALAWCAVGLAQESDPDHGLASLLTTALSAAVPPTAPATSGRSSPSSGTASPADVVHTVPAWRPAPPDPVGAPGWSSGPLPVR